MNIKSDATIDRSANSSKDMATDAGSLSEQVTQPMPGSKKIYIEG